MHEVVTIFHFTIKNTRFREGGVMPRVVQPRSGRASMRSQEAWFVPTLLFIPLLFLGTLSICKCLATIILPLANSVSLVLYFCWATDLCVPLPPRQVHSHGPQACHSMFPTPTSPHQRTCPFSSYLSNWYQFSCWVIQRVPSPNNSKTTTALGPSCQSPTITALFQANISV